MNTYESKFKGTQIDHSIEVSNELEKTAVRTTEQHLSSVQKDRARANLDQKNPRSQIYIGEEVGSGNVVGEGSESILNKYVSTEPQSFTASQRKQARDNIAAASADEIAEAVQRVDEKIAKGATKEDIAQTNALVADLKRAYEQLEDPESVGTAERVSYDNTESGLSAVTVQGALDEVVSRVTYCTQEEYDALVAAGTVRMNVQYNIVE